MAVGLIHAFLFPYDSMPIFMFISHVRDKVAHPESRRWRCIDKRKPRLSGLQKRLHSADNPAEIAHGFPVLKVENKRSHIEYITKAARRRTVSPCSYITDLGR